MKELKEKLKYEEVIVMGDFAENYKYCVQDASQGYHWTNDQPTLHPVVMYYKEDELKHRSYCYLTECSTHNTVVWRTFQEDLVKKVDVT